LVNPTDTISPDKIRKYLNRYGEKKWSLALSYNKRYEAAVVVPVLDEYENIKKMLLSVSACESEYLDKTLVILAVNNIEDCEDSVRENNFRTLGYLNKIADKEKCGDEFIDRIIDSGMNLGLIDMTTAGNEMDNKKGGVGIARKAGMDLALGVLDYECENKRILICLDADCTVQPNYLTEIISSFNNRQLMAAHVNYEHPLPEDKDNRLAIVCYEIFLRYYVLGLKYAGSPFAIHTVGSTMVCTDEAYASVQGMNRRKAAEDFYFMEKLAKLYDIHKIEGTTIFPSGRGSWRVPFGTGQRVNRFLSKTQNEYELYSPHSFKLLKAWNEIYYEKSMYTAAEYLDRAEKLNVNLCKFLVLNSFVENWKNISANARTAGQLHTQKKMWFDGFRTLKLIHFLRDVEFKNENMFDSLDLMFELNRIDIPQRDLNSDIPEFEIQMKYLNILRTFT
jgi:hypothetical protein